MPLNKINKITIILSLLLLIVSAFSCRPAPYEQKIDGIILHDDKGIGNVKVRFLSAYSKDNCSGQGLETTTDGTGKFTFSPKYTPVAFERFDVLIHDYSLCIYLDDQWQTAWNLKTGPAPHSVDFKCYLDNSEKKVENCLVSWDKQEYR